MSISAAGRKDAGIIAGIISRSNKDVAKRFGINATNTPKHPSFCTLDWVLADFERGEEYFLFQEEGKNIGCVAYEHAEPGVAYLNRLSVLPGNRRLGVGKNLVHHVLEYSRVKNVSTVSI